MDKSTIGLRAIARISYLYSMRAAAVTPCSEGTGQGCGRYAARMAVAVPTKA